MTYKQKRLLPRVQFRPQSPTRPPHKRLFHDSQIHLKDALRQFMIGLIMATCYYHDKYRRKRIPMRKEQYMAYAKKWMETHWNSDKFKN